MDSTQKIANCIRAAACDLCLPVPTEQQAKNIIGLALGEAMQVLFKEQDDTMIDRIIERYKYHFITLDDTRQGLFGGVEQGLQSLAEQGVLLAVATGKARNGLKRVFNLVDIEHHFITSRCADETRSKPHPQMLNEILEFTAIDRKNSIMVGDTTFDMEMAANAGMHGLGCSYGVHSEKSLRQAKAIDVLNSFEEIVNWFLNQRVVSAYG